MARIRKLVAASAGTCVAVGLLAACGPPVTGMIGIGVDAAGQPVGHLKVCRGAHMDGARLYAEPVSDRIAPVASWDARPAVTGSSTWSFDQPGAGWVVQRAVQSLKPGVVYHLDAGADDGTGYGGYVLFTLEDLKELRPGQVRVYDFVRQRPTGEPTGSLDQQLRDENDQFMRVITQHDFEEWSCPS